MTNRRRRWLRRFAIGVSIAAFAAPAAAKPTPAGGGGGVALHQSAILRPDDRSDRFTVGQQQLLLASAAVRPDDRADRFAISDGASSATSASNSGVSWDGVVTVGLGTLVLVLALGLGLGYVRRPKVARI